MRDYKESDQYLLIFRRNFHFLGEKEDPEHWIRKPDQGEKIDGWQMSILWIPWARHCGDRWWWRAWSAPRCTSRPGWTPQNSPDRSPCTCTLCTSHLVAWWDVLTRSVPERMFWDPWSSKSTFQKHNVPGLIHPCHYLNDTIQICDQNDKDVSIRGRCVTRED